MYRGVSSQDSISDKLSQEMRGMKFPKIYREPVDVGKVHMAVIQDWIERRLEEYIPGDDILVQFTLELIQGNSPDIRKIQLQLVPFLGSKDAEKFCKELWGLLLSAQEDKDGIPAALLERRKQMIEEERKNYRERNKREQPRERSDRGEGHGDYNRRDFRDSKRENRRDHKRDYKKERPTSSRDSMKSRSRSRSPTH